MILPSLKISSMRFCSSLFDVSIIDSFHHPRKARATTVLITLGWIKSAPVDISKGEMTPVLLAMCALMSYLSRKCLFQFHFVNE